MKKFMILAAVAAMAFGAQAALPEGWRNYTFSLTISDLPQAFQSLTGTAAVYLTDGNSVYAYATMEKFNAGTPDELSGKIAYGSTELHDGASVTLDGKTYANKAHYLEGTSTILQENQPNNQKDVQFLITFDTDGSFGTDHFESVGDNQWAVKDLYVVLSDSKNGYENYYQEIPLTVTGDPTKNPTLAADASYSSVPEPTSAMLLLLGVAGLCLKRKVA